MRISINSIKWDNIYAPNTYMCHPIVSNLCIGISLKRDGVKLVYGPKHPLIDIWWRHASDFYMRVQLQHSHKTGLAALLQRNIFLGNKVFVGKAGIRNIEFWQYMYI
jgi:hypothetical protein